MKEINLATYLMEMFFKRNSDFVKKSIIKPVNEVCDVYFDNARVLRTH